MTYTVWQQHDHIRELQEYLRMLALVDSHYRELAVDGVFGAETADAVRQFQLVHNLPVTGRVDTALWEQLFQAYSDALILVSPAVPVQLFPFPPRLLRLGEQGNLIVILQAMLNTLADTARPLTVTGRYDAATEARVRELQQASGYPPTGEIDRRFWDFLALWYNQEAHRAPSPTA